MDNIKQMNLDDAAKLIHRPVNSLRYAARAGKLNFATAFQKDECGEWIYWVDSKRLKKILESDGEMSLFNA